MASGEEPGRAPGVITLQKPDLAAYGLAERFTAERAGPEIGNRVVAQRFALPESDQVRNSTRSPSMTMLIGVLTQRMPSLW
ncbi:hypothetical protein [Allosalinactinospora lopnorensis]|uniref:hypothetical protein n=1 Tax=Allosalinactinospora lopnorensis TaxID=1352348 RepID=UPI001F33685A|nr:hypothetical protein [Allosalinactinospora lopnorensis]